MQGAQADEQKRTVFLAKLSSLDPPTNTHTTMTHYDPGSEQGTQTSCGQDQKGETNETTQGYREKTPSDKISPEILLRLQPSGLYPERSALFE